MKSRAPLLGLITALTVLAILFVWLLWSAPKHPVALLRVVDAGGKPITGAIIIPDGLRPKPGNYGGHYGWQAGRFGVTNDAALTDSEGFARVPYPRYVFERIETGQISFSVNHPDYVSDRPFRVVATMPPAGAPWRDWLKNLGDRLQHKTLIVRPDPVVLQKGAILKLTRDASAPTDGKLFAQVSGEWSSDTNYWLRPGPGSLLTRRLAPGARTFRALQFDTNGAAWFSEVMSLTTVSGQTNVFQVALRRGVAVHGRLDSTVPRPVVNGRVIAHVWPNGHKPDDHPPDWHAWSPVGADGSFDLPSLPPGKLEIVALCDGFVSTNGSGNFPSLTYPQLHTLGTGDLEIGLGMTPTARLEVKVLDDAGNPLKDAMVSTWPNVRYGEWAATILASDCYNTADVFQGRQRFTDGGWFRSVSDFQGQSDSNGVAVLANLPTYVTEFAVEHPRFVLPAVANAMGGKNRTSPIKLVPGTTNHAYVKLERSEQAPIKHY